MKAHPWLGRSCLWLCLLWTLPGHALDPNRQYYQYQYVEAPAKAGLGHGVHAMVQDQNGFLWLATYRGLVRFDGHDADLFRAIDHSGLISNRVTDLWTTRAGDVLIASEQGMSRFDGERFESIVGGNKWSAYIRAMAETDSGDIWLGSARGLFQWRDDDLRPVHGDHVGSVSALHAQGNTLFVGTEGALYRVEAQSVAVLPLPDTLAGQTITDLTAYKDRVWGITKGGLFFVDNGQVVHLDRPELQGRIAEHLLADRDDNLWFYGKQDLGRLLPNGEIELPDVGLDEFGIGAEVAAMVEAPSGHLWMASRLWAVSALMDAPLRRLSFNEGLLSAEIQAVATDAEDRVLLATPAGINRLKGEHIEVVLETDAFAAAPARTMLQDEQGQLWIGTSRGLRRYDYDSGELQSVPHIDPVPINALADDPNDPGTLWIGTDLGLEKWRNGQVTTLPATTGVAVESLFFDQRGKLWIGTETGLVSMGADTLTLHATELPATLDAVLDIEQLASGQIIATSRNHGLLVSTPDGWQQYTERQGLPKASIVDIELRHDNVWLVSTAGLFRFDVNQIYAGASQLDVRAVVSLDRYRAMHVDLCCSGDNDAAAAFSDSVLVAATRDGIISLDVDQPDVLPSRPAPYIKFLQVNDQARRRASGEPVTLTGEAHRLRIDYSALSLDDDGRLEFRYRVRGRDDQWLHVERARTVYLSNLPPGDFSFELQASVTPGQWVGATETLAIRRQPGLTETLAFRAMLWIGSIALVLGLFWLRSTVARHRHRVLETQIRERTQTLRDVNAELESRNLDLRRVSETDALTGLLNRRYFDTRRSSDDIDASFRDEGILIMIDIDHFKRINDTWGHAAGDAVLRQFAEVLRAATRESDVIARWGGEEFMLLCRCQASHAVLLLERIVAAVRAHAFTLDNGDHVTVHASLGAVRYPLWPGHPMEERFGVQLELADAALYRVKSCGRDGWALLRGKTAPDTHIKMKRAGPLLSALISDGHLTWSASRPSINPDEALSTLDSKWPPRPQNDRRATE